MRTESLSRFVSPAGTLAATAFLLVACAAGCLTSAIPSELSDDDTTTSREPDDTPAAATPVDFDAGGAATIEGTISSADDIDMFELGPLSPGDHIYADIQGDVLDADIAVYDASERLFIQNDGRSDTDPNPLVDEIVRHDSGTYYLAVAASRFAAPANQTGSYTGTIIIRRAEAIPSPQSQAVLLDFDGGTISIPSVETVTVGPFDAADIDPAYAGQTAAVKRSIIDTVKASYHDVALVVYDTDSNPAPAGLAVSTIFFGALSRTALGISQDVDAYNHDPTDSSIIFTDDFSLAVLGALFEPADLGHTIGNVTAHEIGHLLGLNHVQNPTDIMDVTGGASSLVGTQTFQNSPLDVLMLPLGTQDAPLLLAETLGQRP